MKRAGFDIRKVSPIEEVKKCKVPALFMHADDDNFVRPRHSSDLYKEYGGVKVNYSIITTNLTSFFMCLYTYMSVYLSIYLYLYLHLYI